MVCYSSWNIIMDMASRLGLVLCVLVWGLSYTRRVCGICVWPDAFKDTQWYDSSHGAVEFSTTDMSGWKVQINALVATEWYCHIKDTFDTDGRLVIITKQSHVLLANDAYYAYVCLTLTKVTDASYKYYINNAKLGVVQNQRVFMYQVETLTDVGTICSDVSGASDGEYQTFIRKGDETTAKVNCPWSFLGNYGYTHRTPGGTVTCDQNTSEMETCTSSNEMKFDYTACATKVTYSNSDTVWCVGNVPVGDTNYIMLYNGNDDLTTIDADQNLYQFTCIAISDTPGSASVSPQYCQENQNTDSMPVNKQGQQIGALLTLADQTATCPTCPMLSNPDRGNVSIATNGAATVATYACDSPFTLIGVSERTCQAANTWSDAEPFCNCAPPIAPSNGAITVNTEGSITTYQCNVGYTLDGPATRNCLLASATWEGVDPVCRVCVFIASAAGRTHTVNTNGTMSTVAFECVDAYSMDGVAALTCLMDGQWNGQLPTCVACGFLTNPHSGFVVTKTDGFVSTATYTCEHGYTMTGSSTRTCQLSGDWDGVAAVCKCNSPGSPDNGGVVANGETATYTCASGYTINGDPTRTCQTDGTGWTGGDPTCTPCEVLANVTGGTYTMTSSGVVTSAKLSCMSGYSLNGDSTISCLSSGQWETPPSCALCQQLTNPSSGQVTLTSSGTVTSASYACAAAYNLIGNFIRLCQPDGSWTNSEPACECKTPSVLTNGNLTADGTTATYTCDIGYTLDGPSVRTCATDGSGWSDNDPTCKSCPALTAPANGNMFTSTNGATTEAWFNCTVGYALSGVSPIVCGSTGAWNFASPSCARCHTLASPTSGSVSLSGDGSVTTATFSCVSGYYLSGTLQLTCDSSGLWNGAQPSCKCSFPSNPQNGDVYVSDNALGHFATYSCIIGYSLSGLVTRQCQSDGTGWEGTSPTCVICPTIASPTSGSFTLSTNSTYTMVTYSCLQGTTISGDTARLCQSNGVWNGTMPTCVSCPNLTLASGSVTLSTAGSVTTATFECVSGYTLNSTSSSVLSCTQGGAWDKPAPYCLCNSPSTLSNGDWVLSANQRTATYTCESGYVLDGPVTRECQDDGTGWSGSDPKCGTVPSVAASTDDSDDSSTIPIHIAVIVVLALLLVIICIVLGVFVTFYIVLRRNASRLHAESEAGKVRCSDIPAPTGGNVQVSTDGQTTTAVFTCQPGYTMVGVATLACKTDTSWDQTLPTCTKCDTLNSPFSGQVTVVTDGLVSTANYTCTTNYHLVGTGTRDCQPNGTWDLSAPICECDAPAAPNNGDVTADGSTATYTCSLNYTLSEPSSRTCGIDGTWWSETDPTCSQCGPSPYPTYVAFQNVITSGTQTSAVYKCNTGYTRIGPDTLLCLPDATWEALQPCVECDPLKDPNSGDVSLSSTGNITIGTYTCASGYSLLGATTRTCTTDGTWDLAEPSCYCQSPSTPANSIMMEDGVTANYSCNVGYSLDGTKSRTCATDGSGWSDTDPICTACNPLTSPSGGQVTQSTDGLNTNASFTCDVGYTINGPYIITCTSTGTWTGNSPTCVQCVSLGDLPSGTITMGTDSYVTGATFACVAGYYMVGVSSSTCGTDGQWSEALPICKCIFPSTPDHGTISISDSSLGSIVSYKCEQGYSIDGSSSRLCQSDGTGWNGTDPTCSTCDTLPALVGGTVSYSDNGLNTKALFTCDNGYTLNGTDTITCGDDGKWNANSPNCTICQTLDELPSGTVTLTTDGYITTATFSCVSGYYITGTSTVTCDTAGQWSDQSPVCKCNNPHIPDHGTMIVSDSAKGPVASYECEQGYSINGPSSRVCYPDGTGWNGTEPTCSTCDVLPTVVGGTITYSDDGLNTRAVFTCDTGYTLNGTNTITCGNDGKWNTNPSQCTQCRTLDDLPSGTVTLTTDGYITTATFSCVSGYYITGTSTVTCDTAGQWSDQAPVCKCNNPSTPDHGTLLVSDSPQGPVATYNCEQGYSINGPSSRLCYSDGTGWNGTDPTCSACDTLPSLAGGNTTFSVDGVNTKAIFTCDTGYTLNGTDTITCGNDGKWNANLPQCAQCQTVDDLPSGTVTMTTDGYISTVTFSCVSGYYITGTSTVTCDTAGQWSDQAPVCKCINPSTPDYGTMVVSDSPLGPVASYNCDQGYSINGPSSRLCYSDGTGWNGTDPTCSTCDTLSSLVGGAIAFSIDGLNTKAMFTCNSGYTLNGINAITCGNDGKWNANPPQCVQCQTLDDLPSGTIAMTTDGYITTATFSCVSGYYITGTSTVTCDTAGQWSDQSPVCKCTNPAIPDHGAMLVSDSPLGPVATYKCEQGYSLSGSSSRQCESDGTGWNGTDPTCSTCELLAAPPGGMLSLSTDDINTKSTFTCDVGYSLSGPTSVTCGSDGQWDAAPPQCVQCPSLSNQSSGSVSMTTDGYTTTATFSCISGYYLFGARSVTCGTDGQWSGQSPLCKCNFPSAPAHGAMSVTDSPQGSVATYTCQQGYSIDGLFSRLCQSDGTGWEGTDPSCTECNNIVTPVGLLVTLSTNGILTRASYTCAVNYTLVGESQHDCRGDGSWSMQQPTCSLCDTPQDPTSGAVTLSTDGLVSVATWTCVVGYALNSSSVTRCQANGTWDLPDPVCVCRPPTAIPNGGITVSIDGREANYSCETGYQMIGADYRVCLDDGTGWNGTQPRCELTGPPTGASTEDELVLSLHAGVLIGIAVAAILSVLIIVFVIIKCKRDSPKIGVNSAEETAGTGDKPEAAIGADRVAATRYDPKSSPYTVKRNANGTTNGTANGTAVHVTQEKKSVKSPKKSKVRSTTTETTPVTPPTTRALRTGRDLFRDEHQANDDSVPYSSRHLPKLPPRPSPKKEPKVKEPKVKKRKKIQAHPDEEREAIVYSPVDMQMSGCSTPEILSQAEFDYIHPQYTPEVNTPVNSRPGTGASMRKDFKSKSSVF